MKWGFKKKWELVIGFLNFGLGLSGLVASGLTQRNEMGFVKRKENMGISYWVFELWVGLEWTGGKWIKTRKRNGLCKKKWKQ